MNDIFEKNEKNFQCIIIHQKDRSPDFDTFFNFLRIFLVFSIVLRHPKFFFKERLDLLVPFCKE